MAATRALARPDLLDTTRLAMLAALAATGAVVPIPLVPAAIERQVRGSVAHDVAARAGLSMTLEARAVLSDVVTVDSGRVVLREAAGYLARRVFRRISPMRALAPARAGLEIFALGVLFERYVRTLRRGDSVRIDESEARGVRTAIDLAVTRALRPRGVATEFGVEPHPPEDLRDDLTRVLDTVLLAGAGVPGYLVRRIENAFDEIARERPDLFHD